MSPRRLPRRSHIASLCQRLSGLSPAGYRCAPAGEIQPPPKDTYCNGAILRHVPTSDIFSLPEDMSGSGALPSLRYAKKPRPFIDDTTNGRGFLQLHLGPRGWMSISGALVRLRQGMVGQKRSLRHIASRTYFLSTRILSKERRPSTARLALC